MSSPIYLDHNATTPLLPEVADAIREAALKYPANPGSQHEPGRQARRALETARQRVGQLLGARTSGLDADRVIFTSGGTEAANLAIFGLLGTPRGSASEGAATAPGHLITTKIEHPCILAAAAQLPHCRVTHLDVDTSGVVQIEQLQQHLTPDTQLVSVMLANNETGVLQPVGEIAALCADQGVALHTDAAQVIGKLPVDFEGLNVSALSCAAHKFYGPLGIGALIVRHDLPLQPTLFGGHQQAGLRPGTEMVALAIGMATALECWHREAAAHEQRLGQLRDQFEQSIRAELPYVEVIGAGAARLPNTSNLAFVGLNRQALLMALDQAGIACSSGSACASGSSEPSPVLLAMGLNPEILDGAVRFSLGHTTTASEIASSCRRILSVCQRLR
jgi:cysteine desulfurase